jgi:hypothetical protein
LHEKYQKNKHFRGCCCFLCPLVNYFVWHDHIKYTFPHIMTCIILLHIYPKYFLSSFYPFAGQFFDKLHSVSCSHIYESQKENNNTAGAIQGVSFFIPFIHKTHNRKRRKKKNPKLIIYYNVIHIYIERRAQSVVLGSNLEIIILYL